MNDWLLSYKLFMFLSVDASYRFTIYQVEQFYTIARVTHAHARTKYSLTHTPTITANLSWDCTGPPSVA